MRKAQQAGYVSTANLLLQGETDPLRDSRFQAMAPKGVVAAAQKDLPKDPEELLEQVQANALHPLAERENARAFDYLWSTAWTAAVKLQDYRYTCFTSPASHVQPKLQNITSSDRRRLFAEKLVFKA